MSEQKRNLKVGYVVGVGEDDEIVFEVIGSQPGLIEVMGCHAFAEHKISLMRDLLQDCGTPLMKKGLNSIGKLQTTIIELLTGLYTALNKPLPVVEKKDKPE